ncbi:LlaJI family restriction endonuclease [Rahnella aquatilis]|uniref:LlaJI family restriction endonuclease n=1 Tax=Rahnella aquatilis TaxID=34038 RepID=UPI0036577F59
MINNVFYTDRELISELPIALINIMKANGLVSIDMLKIHYCGIILHKKELAIFLPRGSRVDIYSDSKSISRSLLRSINRYQTSLKNTIDNNDSGESVIGQTSLSTIISLLDDYKNNGIYVRRIRQNIRNNGTVNWRNTINKTNAYTVGDDVFYPDTLGTRHRNLHDSEVSRIHAQIIRHLCDQVGWITFDNPSIVEQELIDIPLPSNNHEHTLITLKQELGIVYSDRDILLIKNLITYLNILKGDNQDSIIIGIREFHGMWEQMLNNCLRHKEKMNHRLMAPLFKISGEYYLAPEKGQRTDTIVKHPEKNNYVVIDAKYYAATSINTSPSLADIVKQFYYSQAIKLTEPESKIINNVFVFPGLSGNIESIHMAIKTKNKKYGKEECMDNDYSPITCIYQDPIELIKSYASGRYLEKLNTKIIELCS